MLGLGALGTRNYHQNNLSKSVATGTLGDLKVRLGDREERGHDISVGNSLQMTDRPYQKLNNSVAFVGLSKELKRMRQKEAKSKGKWTVHNRTNETMMTWCDKWWEPPQQIRNIREDNQEVVQADSNNAQLQKQIKQLV